ISLFFLILAIVLGLVISPTLSPDSLNWLWLVFIVLLFCSIGGLWVALQYTGVSSVKLPRGHRVRPFLEKAALERYRDMSVSSSKYPFPIVRAVLQKPSEPRQADSQAESQAKEDRSVIWKVGDVIFEQFEVTGILGEGGMGIVYKIQYRV